MAFLIRTASEEDISEMVAILNPIIEHGGLTLMDEVYTETEQRDYLCSFPDRGLFLVAECTETHRVVGMQSLEPTSDQRSFQHIGDISTFVLLGEGQQGVGTLLTKALLLQAPQKGYRKVMAMVRGDNPQALQFYQRQGFRWIGVAREQACIRGRYVDEVWLERLLISEQDES